MKKIKQAELSAILVMCILILLSVGTVFKTVRILAQGSASVIISGELDAFSNSIENIDKLWNKCFINKEKLSKADSIISFWATGRIFSEQVILGNNGWLFYKAKTDSNPIGDFEGTNNFSKEEIDKAIEGVQAIDSYCNERDIKYSILVVPNKERVYPEYMPDEYKYAKESRTDQLAEQMADLGYNVINCKEALLEEKKNKQLYYSYDTHWNQNGANIGLNLMLNSMGLTLVPESELSSKKELLKKTGYHYCGQDDLAQMIGLRDIVFKDELEYEIDNYPSIDLKKFETEQEAGNVSYFYNSDAIYKSKFLLIGDSFRTALVPGACYYFSDVYVIHVNYCKKDIIDEISPDYLAFQYVERYSYRLCDIGEMVDLRRTK